MTLLMARNIITNAYQFRFKSAHINAVLAISWFEGLSGKHYNCLII